MRKRLSLLAFCLAFPLWADSARRATLGPVSIQTDETRLRIGVATDYVLFSDSGDSVSGIVVGGDLQYALSRHWALGAGVRQAFSSSDFSAFFTQIHLCLARAITGAMLAKQERVLVSGTAVSEASAPAPRGWVGRFYLAQYLINTTGAVLPYTGLGLGVSYDWNLGARTPISVGVRVDRLSNGTKTYFPMSAFAALGLWL